MLGEPTPLSAICQCGHHQSLHREGRCMVDYVRKQKSGSFLTTICPCGNSFKYHITPEKI